MTEAWGEVLEVFCSSGGHESERRLYRKNGGGFRYHPAGFGRAGKLLRGKGGSLRTPPLVMMYLKQHFERVDPIFGTSMSRMSGKDEERNSRTPSISGRPEGVRVQTLTVDKRTCREPHAPLRAFD